MKLQTPILITGASGFVGANLLRRLIKDFSPLETHVLLRKSSKTWRIDDLLKKVPIHIIDLRKQKDTEKLIQRIKPKIIFHLATHGAYLYQQANEKEILETNVICTFNLIQACMAIGFDAFINTGTSSEYGINPQPMSEKDRPLPVTPYGVCKVWATLYGRYLTYAAKVPITTLRLFGVYGPFEPRGRLIPNIILALLNKEQPTLVSSDFVRDFVYVGDVVDAFMKAAETKSREPVLNIGSGTKTTLGEIFDLTRRIMNVETEPKQGSHANYQIDADRRIADIRLAKKFLKWKPKTDLAAGLKQTIAWFKKNKHLYM